MDDLDGHLAIDGRLVGPIHGCHAARGDLCTQLVRAEICTDHHLVLVMESAPSFYAMINVTERLIATDRGQLQMTVISASTKLGCLSPCHLVREQRLITTLLIANRGEIACRIVRT